MMATKPASEVFDELMTPEQIARSDAKADALRFGVLINRLRTQQGLSQQDLADKLGVTQQAVSKMEWGDEIWLTTLRKVVAALGGEIVLHMPNQEISLSQPIAAE